MLTKKQFKEHYIKVLQDIRKNIDINTVTKDYISKTDYDYYSFNMEQYLDNSFIRAFNIYKLLPAAPCSIADVGGFFGNFSLCFARLGYKVTLFESYEYYGDCFNSLIPFLKNEGIEIQNFNFTKATQLPDNSFDVTLCLAFLEHLSTSPKVLIDNLKSITKEKGFLFLEVPNIASIGNRLQLLAGITILPDISTIYKSTECFMGHFHEYTRLELRNLAKLSQLRIITDTLYNYSNHNSLLKRIVFMPSYIIPSLREIVLIKTQKDNS